MVKLKGPMSSVSAAGTVGKTLVFSNWRGRAYARKLTLPAQPRPPQQLASRAAHSFLTDQWDNLDGSYKISWDDHPRFATTDLFRAYLHENLRTWNINLATSALYPTPRTQTHGTIIGFQANPQGRRAEFSITVLAANQSWGLMLLHDSATITTTEQHRTIKLVPLLTPGTHTWWYGPLPAGTHYFSYMRFTFDGSRSALGPNKTVTIA